MSLVDGLRRQAQERPDAPWLVYAGRTISFADAEALYSYEGTYQMQNLIVGKAVTGLSAFV